ncbi:MAG TPA: CvpA family protein [Bryobacteraceae bacterium]|nr:CvpA family protein [Bryobacteraceae bacterium]
MNWFDIVLIIIVVASVANGFARGFIRIGIGFIATVLAFLLAAWFYGSAGALLTPVIHSPVLANVAGFGLVFAAVMVVGAITSALLARALRLVGLGLADRAGGAALGAVRGILFCVILLVGILAFSKKTPAAVAHSHFAPYLTETAQYMANLTPYEIRNGVRRQYQDLKRVWTEVIHKKKADTQEI